ncbi:hypothetical protein FGU65_00205 [Methanoculleus sp. FWC-SCC1]|uniref:Uncharacterized protein n=1 Tax=Methanoculleus frigidifontis TaxID=2584085 RepID=A0ABT8M5W7_9EURY|nr:hypothetical protein [Methanoculleus sp. FWC-SCC1]MDN7023334.1 hypothetical protein [Methanoculleus sp. FWC-SCC1]
MNLIRTLITLGAVFYIAVMLAQAAGNASVLVQAGIGIAVLAAAAVITWQRETLALKNAEMALLWASVLGFVVYALGGGLA